VKPEIKTTQSEGEMELAFAPGSAFGFNVILQLEKSDSDEEDSEEKPDSDEDSEEKPDSDDDLKEQKSGSSE